MNQLREQWLAPVVWTKEKYIEFPASNNGPWKNHLLSIGENGVRIARWRFLEPCDDSYTKNLSERTLTLLYNQNMPWLVQAHKKLDSAVFAAYGWPEDLSDEQILEKLLELNLQRAGQAA